MSEFDHEKAYHDVMAKLRRVYYGPGGAIQFLDIELARDIISTLSDIVTKDGEEKPPRAAIEKVCDYIDRLLSNG